MTLLRLAVFGVFAAVCAVPAFAQEETGAAPEAAQPAVQEKAVRKMEVNVDKLAQLQWDFYKEQAEDKNNKEITETLLGHVKSWLRANSDKKSADQVLLAKATLEERMGDYRSSLVSLLKHCYEYPESNLVFTVKSNLNTLAADKADRKVRPVISELSKGDNSAAKQDRLAAFLRKMSEQTGASFYEPMVAEFEDFFARYPGYHSSDVLLIALANLHMQKEKYLSAVMEYNKIPAFYAESTNRAKAISLAGDVYASNLRRYDDAMKAYQNVVDNFPGTPEAGKAYEQMAKIAELKKQYDLAVDIYNKMIELYPGKDAAYNAFQAQARLLRKELSRPGDAIDALLKLADMFKGDKAVAAYKLAAEIAGKDMRDYPRQIEMLEKVVSSATLPGDAANALFDEATIYEKELKDMDKALEVYQRVVDGYPGDSISKSAEKRIKSLTKN